MRPVPAQPSSRAAPPSSGAAHEVQVRASDPLGIAVRIVGVAVVAGVSLWLVVTLRSILLELLIAVILATGLKPLVDRLEKRGVKRALAVLLMYVALIAVIALFASSVVPLLARETENFIANAPTYGERATAQLRSLQAQFPFLPPLDTQVQQQISNLGSQIGVITSQAVVVGRVALNIFSGVLNTILVLLLTLYLVVDGPHIRDYFLSFARPDNRPYLREVTGRMGGRMGGWLMGQLTLSFVVGLVSWIGLTIIGVPGAVLLAVIAGIGEAIPIVGPIASAIPAILVAATISPGTALLTLVLYLAIQQLENNLLVPKIMERAVNLHPMAVIVALLAGGQLLGIVGSIVAVPVAAALSVVLDELRYERRKRLEAETADAPEAVPARPGSEAP